MEKSGVTEDLKVSVARTFWLLRSEMSLEIRQRPGHIEPFRPQLGFFILYTVQWEERSNWSAFELRSDNPIYIFKNHCN